MQPMGLILLIALASTATDGRALLARIVSDPTVQQAVIGATKHSVLRHPIARNQSMSAASYIADLNYQPPPRRLLKKASCLVL
jgi:hypothetical protein